MPRAKGGDKLVCRHNGWVWVDWQIDQRAEGVALVAPCDLGDHFLQVDGTVGPEPHCWASAVEAVEAWDAWREKRQ